MTLWKPDEPGPPASSAGGRSPVARLRRRIGRAGAAVPEWLEQRRRGALPVDLAMTFYERDREQFASVLGAAIALRLFLFLVPASASLAGLFLLVFGPDAVDTLLRQASVTGSLAAQVQESTQVSRSTALALFLGGLWLSVWAGRNFAKVLGACAAQAWRLSGRQSRVTLRVASAVTALVLGLLVVSAGLSRLRAQFGIATDTASWLATVAVLATLWFTISLVLPRRTADPGALLPGAAFVGLTMTGLQWFMQFYLPGRINRASELVGSLGLAVAVLGYAFLVGRVMAASFIIDAVVWERFGSISGLVFSLPGLHRLPARFPRLARFFDLEGSLKERPDAGRRG
jgi:Virulence factor BrkB